MRRCLIALLTLVLLASCASGDQAAPTTPAPASPTITASPTDRTPTEAPATTPTTPTPEPTVPTESPTPTPAPPAIPTEQVEALVADRPYTFYAPATYDPGTPMPLLVTLHGYTANATIIEEYFGFEDQAETYGFLYARPEGTRDTVGHQFWNAGDACCGIDRSVDDTTYLRAVIEDVMAHWTVDPERVVLLGHSNGSFMAFRMACEHADVITAIVSIAGATFADPDDCQPSEPVSVLHLHGTSDDIISYWGGTFQENVEAYPGAVETAETWATYNDCTGYDTTPEALDLDSVQDGNETANETDIHSYAPCANGTRVELWEMHGVRHAPTPTATLSTALLDFLLGHPRA